MKNTPLRLALLLILLLIWGSCESYRNPGADNPLDPDNPGYIEPEVSIVFGPGYDETVNTTTVTFGLHYNETASELKYMLDQGEWSAWQTDTTVTLTYLDEGAHEIVFKARNSTGVEQDGNIGTYFIVDAVQGPALMFVPRKVTVQPNVEFRVEIYAEEVVGLAGLTVSIQKSDVLELVHYQVFDESDERTFLGKDANLLSVPEVNTTESMLTLALMRVGKPAAVSGTGDIAMLTLKLKSSLDTQMNFSMDCVMLDSVMQVISINELVPLEIFKK